MNVTLTIQRGEVAMLSYDDQFQARLEAHLEAHPEDGDLRNQNSLYRKLMTSRHAIVDAIEKVLGKDGHKPFSITINVEGDKKIYPPGPVLY